MGRFSLTSGLQLMTVRTKFRFVNRTWVGHMNEANMRMRESQSESSIDDAVRARDLNRQSSLPLAYKLRSGHNPCDWVCIVVM